jgi:predicted O-linked N-acetylglucosamine transferase (SPINDLY family)
VKKELEKPYKAMMVLLSKPEVMAVCDETFCANAANAITTAWDKHHKDIIKRRARNSLAGNPRSGPHLPLANVAPATCEQEACEVSEALPLANDIAKELVQAKAEIAKLQEELVQAKAENTRLKEEVIRQHAADMQTFDLMKAQLASFLQMLDMVRPGSHNIKMS